MGADGMSIDKIYGRYAITCDNCETMLPHEDSWEDARDALKDAGWWSYREGGEWHNLCPECLAVTT